MPLIVPVDSEDHDYTVRTELGGKTLELRFLYNERLDRWSMDVANEDGLILVAGIPLVLGCDLLAPYGLNLGSFYLVDMEARKAQFSPAITFEDASAAYKVASLEDEWRYYLTTSGAGLDFSSPTYDDSSWSTGIGGFGNYAPGYETPPASTLIMAGVGNRIWLRKDLGPLEAGIVLVDVYHDDGAAVWLNGVPGVETRYVNYFHSWFQFPASAVSTTGSNILALRVTDGEPFGNPTYFYAGMNAYLNKFFTDAGEASARDFLSVDAGEMDFGGRVKLVYYGEGEE